MYRRRTYIDIQILHYLGARTRNREDSIFNLFTHRSKNRQVSLIELEESVIHQMGKDIVRMLTLFKDNTILRLYALHRSPINLRKGMGIIVRIGCNTGTLLRIGT